MEKQQRALLEKTERKVFFFSDVHLGAGSKKEEQLKEERLIKFLNAIKHHASEIYILGDLFDYWFEYKTVVPKGFYKLFTMFSELRDNGVRLFFIAGNHDYWIGNYFRDEFGMEIHYEPFEKVILGKRFYLHHGDGLIKNDVGYKILKCILRNRVNIVLYSWLHPDCSSKIARWSSRKSRNYTSNRQYEEDGMVKFAAEKIKEGFDFVVMGHNHQPGMTPLGNGIYVNLGEWMEKPTYGVFDGEKMVLKKWLR